MTHDVYMLFCLRLQKVKERTLIDKETVQDLINKTKEQRKLLRNKQLAEARARGADRYQSNSPPVFTVSNQPSAQDSPDVAVKVK